jgi:hypothetical protein
VGTPARREARAEVEARLWRRKTDHTILGRAVRRRDTDPADLLVILCGQLLCELAAVWRPGRVGRDQRPCARDDRLLSGAVRRDRGDVFFGGADERLAVKRPVEAGVREERKRSGGGPAGRHSESSHPPPTESAPAIGRHGGEDDIECRNDARRPMCGERGCTSLLPDRDARGEVDRA